MDLLNDLFRAAPWPTLRTGLHIACVLTLGILLWRLLQLRSAVPLGHLAKPRVGFAPLAIGVALALAAILAYQATWQLGGMTRPRFVAFMQLHDRRQFNPAHWIQRGRILDARGVVLAESQEVAGSVYRFYPYGPVFAHAVGYAQPRFGASGLEAAANVFLNGGEPETLGDWGAIGKHLLVQDKRPRGRDLTATLDARLQVMAVEALGERRGAVVLLRPDDGALLVLASTPAYDPNQIDGALFAGTDPAAPMLNRALQGLYPPGSVFKVIPAALALDAGLGGPLDCPAEGFTTSARYNRIRDHEYYSARRDGRAWGGHGRIDLGRALAKSSNVYFAQLGVQLGHDAYAGARERFLFNTELPVAGPGAGVVRLRTGRLPVIADSDRYGLAQAAIGQGRVLATPGHMAMIVAAIANDGVAVRPRLIATDPPVILGQWFSADTAARLRKLMRRVVTEGTGRGIETPTLPIAGKTGTAQNPHGESHSWFIGFAPAERPRLAVAVLVENSGYGSVVAAPIARDLLLKAAELGLIQ